MAARESSSESSSDWSDSDDSDEAFSMDIYTDENGQVVPYMFEPLAVVSKGDSDDGKPAQPQVPAVDFNDHGRLNNVDWCSCGQCRSMPVARESVCCKEISQIVKKMDEAEVDLNCFTEHPGFNAVCLDKWVLMTAYFHYREMYDEGRHDATENQRNRHIGYRQIARWCWDYLGRKVRVPLPACAVHKIREKYPSNEYRGFQEI